jgi:hypothetical protein
VTKVLYVEDNDDNVYMLKMSDRFQHPIVAFEASDRRFRQYLDIGEALDPIDEIAGHA